MVQHSTVQRKHEIKRLPTKAKVSEVSFKTNHKKYTAELGCPLLPADRRHLQILLLGLHGLECPSQGFTRRPRGWRGRTLECQGGLPLGPRGTRTHDKLTNTDAEWLVRWQVQCGRIHLHPFARVLEGQDGDHLAGQERRASPMVHGRGNSPIHRAGARVRVAVHPVGCLAPHRPASWPWSLLPSVSGPFKVRVQCTVPIRRASAVPSLAPSPTDCCVAPSFEDPCSAPSRCNYSRCVLRGSTPCPVCPGRPSTSSTPMEWGSSCPQHPRKGLVART